MIRSLLRLELVRLRRDPVLLMIVLALPISCYLGAAVLIPDEQVGRERLLGQVLIGMACYGAATAASTVTGQVALERVHGWSRQLALTPLTVRDYLVVKALVALICVSWAVSILFCAAIVSSQVQTSSLRWVLAGVVVSAGALTWGIFGLLIGNVFRTESALAAAAASIVLMSLIGGVFVPVPSEYAPLTAWTPMFGYVTVARQIFGHPTQTGLLVVALVNWAGWTAAFSGAAAWSVRYARNRR